MAIRNQLLTQTEKTMIAFTIDYYIFLLKFVVIEQQLLRFENCSNFDSKITVASSDLVRRWYSPKLFADS